MAEAGRSGGGILLSALKKLDRRLPLPPAGDGGSCDKLSIVRSDSDGRLFLVERVLSSGSGSSWSAYSGSASFSWNPALEPALEEALDAERKPSKLPNASSSLLVFNVDVAFVWRDGGRANGFLKAGALFVEVVARGCWPMLGMPLVRREEGIIDVRLVVLVPGAEAGVAVEGVLERTSEARDVFFWRAAGGWPGREIEEIEEMDGLLRSCSFDGAVRSCD